MLSDHTKKNIHIVASVTLLTMDSEYQNCVHRLKSFINFNRNKNVHPFGIT